MNYVIDRLLDDLNQYGECCVSLTPCHALNIKLFPKNTRPIKVSPFDVPVLLVPLVAHDDWDYTVTKVG